MKKLLVFFLLFIMACAQAETDLSDLDTKLSQKQLHVLATAYHVAVENDVEPTLLQGLVLQESKAGNVRSLSSNGNYGLTQMRLGTAKELLKKDPSLKTYMIGKDLLSNLLTNAEFSLQMTIAYLKTLDARISPYALAAYNKGPGNVSKKTAMKTSYVKGVYRWSRSDDLKALNSRLVEE